MRNAFISSLIAVLSASSTLALKADTIGFEPARIYETGHVPESLAIGDLNGDGKPDVVVGNTFSDASNDGSISTYLGQGDGTFQRLADTSVEGMRPEGVALALINSDSDLDVVTSNFADDSISVLLGKGDGTFEDPIVTHVSGGPRYVVAADFDGDAKIDLATSNYNANSVSILKGDGTGAFVVTLTRTVGKGPEMLTLAKLNDDANVDLVSCNALADSVTPLIGDGAGGFTVGVTHTVGNEPRYLLARDLNGDSLDDLIVANTRTHSISLEQNTGAGSFANQSSISFSSATITLQRPVYVAFEDMNGDGLKDILASWAGTDVFTVSPANANAFGFDTPSAIQTGEEPVGLGAADFDADGDADIFVTNAINDNARVYISYSSDPGVIVDNGAAGATAIGPWAPSDTPFAFGPGSVFSKNGTRYVWESDLPGSGQYEVLLYWTVTANRSKNVPVEIVHADGSTSLVVDETKGVGEWHSIGSYPFDGEGKVTMTAPQDNLAASADAVRFRKLSGAPLGPPRGRIPVDARPRPAAFQIDKNSFLAFQATLAMDNPNESEDFTGAVFTPTGPAEESALISQLRLYIDSNANGTYDSGDRKLGVGRSFASDVRSIVFDNFRETLADKTAVDIFVVADLVPKALSSREVERSAEAPALACGAAVALGLLCWMLRKSLIAFPAALTILLSLALVPISGCGGSGGGGGSKAPGGNPAPGTHGLQIELSSLTFEGESSGTPSIVEDLPASGWEF